MQQKNTAKTEKIKNVLLIVLAALLVAAIIIRAVNSASDGAVSAEYVSSGTLATTLRGSGTVASNSSVDIKSEEDCVVYSVLVQEGDSVSAGDALVECSDYAAASAKTLQEELDALVLEYELALVDKAGAANPKEQTALEKAQRELERAKADCEKSLVTDEELTAAKNKVDAAEKAIAAKEDEIARYEALGVKADTTLADAQKAYDQVMLAHRNNYNTIVSIANTWMQQDGLTVEERTARRSFYIEAVAKDFAKSIEEAKAELGKTDDFEEMENLQQRIKNLQGCVDSYNAVAPALKALEAAQSSTALADAKAQLITLNRQKTDADTALADLKTKRSEYQTLTAAVETKRQAVDAALEALAAAQTTAQKDDMKLKASEEKIAAKREELSALSNNGEHVMIKSPVAGIVSSILTTPGSSATADGALLTLEVPDLGYTVSFPVPRAQSALLSPGDGAVAALGDTKQDAVLKEISAYPDDPAQQQLTFELNGAADAGAVLDLTISKDGEEYDKIVPSAALREDSSGYFVLTVSPKRGLFGTRYVIARVPVQVLARSDEAVAVSGELAAGSMVVTTHPCNLKAGDIAEIKDSTPAPDLRQSSDEQETEESTPQPAEA